MAFKFPFSTLHELNLDWVLEQVKKFSELIPPMESAVDDVQEALNDATEAVSKAEQALEDAGEAITTAEEAKEIAEQAAQGTIADGAVTTPKLANGAVTFDKIADGAVTGSKIDLATIQTGNLSEGCVTSNKILDGTVDTVDLHDGAVTTVKLDDGAVTYAKLASNAKSELVIGTNNGYFKSPDGLLICWGTFSISRNQGQNMEVVSYPHAFNVQPYFAAVSYQTAHPESWMASVSDWENPTTLTAVLYADGGASTNGTMSYFAIGEAGTP